jgi:hypothetical protein
MLTFRLKYLFCLILAVGVALMWWTWACGTKFTACRVLAVRERFSLDPSLGPAIHSDARMAIFVASLDKSFSPPSYEYEKCVWTTNWPLIEARAREENWTFYRHVIVTVLAVLTMGWVAVTGRRK